MQAEKILPTPRFMAEKGKGGGGGKTPKEQPSTPKPLEKRESANPWEYTTKRRAPTEAERNKDEHPDGAKKHGDKLDSEQRRKLEQEGIRYDKDGKRI